MVEGHSKISSFEDNEDILNVSLLSCCQQWEEKPWANYLQNFLRNIYIGRCREAKMFESVQRHSRAKADGLSVMWSND